jgi:hypothetical protein
MGECSARTQGAPIVQLSGRLRTRRCAAQRGRAAQSLILVRPLSTPGGVGQRASGGTTTRWRSGHTVAVRHPTTHDEPDGDHLRVAATEVYVASPEPEPGRSRADSLPPPSGAVSGSTPYDPSQDAVWLTVCAWCDRVRRRGRWVEAGPSFRPQTHLTHGICPTCLDAVLQISRAAGKGAQWRERGDAAP